MMTSNSSVVSTVSAIGVNASFASVATTSAPVVEMASSSSFKWDPILVVIGVVGLLGNAIVFATMVTQSKMLKQVTNVLIVNQSCIDMLAALFLVLVFAIPRNLSLDRSFLSDVIYCRLWYSRIFLWALMLASTGSLLLITIERYIAVLYPIAHKIHVTRRRTVAAIASNWIVCIGYHMVFMLPSTDIVGKRCQPIGVWPSVAASQAASAVTMCVEYFAPVATMAFCYSRMAFVISRKVAPGGQATAGNTGSYDAIKINILKAMVTVCCLFFLCWTTNEIILLLYLVGVPVSLSGWLYNLSIVFVFSSCAVNPFVYAARYKEFQQGFKRLAATVRVALLGPAASSFAAAPAKQTQKKTSSTDHTT